MKQRQQARVYILCCERLTTLDTRIRSGSYDSGDSGETVFIIVTKASGVNTYYTAYIEINLNRAGCAAGLTEQQGDAGSFDRGR